MSNDIFGGLMKGIGAFMPKDDPNMKLFQTHNEINDLQIREQEIYAEIGKKMYPSVKDRAEFADLAAELQFTQKKLRTVTDELHAAENLKTEQEQKEREEMQSRTCANCGTLNPEGIKFCQECGARLNLATKAKCTECGAEFPIGTRFCGGCGSQL